MKKLLLPIFALCGLALTACNTGTKLTDLRQDEVAQSVKDELLINFNDTTNSIRLESDDRTNQKSYYDVYVSNDTKNNLFTYTIEFSKLNDKELTFEEAVKANRFRGASISNLIFNDKIYTEESTAILAEVYNTKYGISKNDSNGKSELLGLKVKTKNLWTETIDCDAAVKAYQDDKKTDIKLQILYMPVFAKRVNDGLQVLKVWVFVPVSYNFVTGDQMVELENNQLKYSPNSFTQYKNVELVFNPTAGKTGFLATKPVEEYNLSK